MNVFIALKGSHFWFLFPLDGLSDLLKFLFIYLLVFLFVCVFFFCLFVFFCCCCCCCFFCFFFYLFLFIYLYEISWKHIYTYRGIYTWIKGLNSRLYWSSPRLRYRTATIHTYIAIDMHNNSSVWLNNLNNYCRQMKGKTHKKTGNGLTNICLVDPSIHINWTITLPILGVFGVLFHFYSISNRYSC